MDQTTLAPQNPQAGDTVTEILAVLGPVGPEVEATLRKAAAAIAERAKAKRKPLATDLQVKSAKAEAKPWKWPVEGAGWLYLVVNPTGSKLWRMGYRFAGKESVLSLGSYPAVSLADARAAAAKARDLIGEGVNPNAEKRAAKARQSENGENTFEAVAGRWRAFKADAGGRGSQGAAAATLAKTDWLLSLASTLNKRPIAALTTADIEAVVHKAKIRQKHSARRLQLLLGEVFRYAARKRLITEDPCIFLDTPKRPEEKHHAAITDPAKVGGLLRAIDGFDGQPTTKAALKLMALLFPRPSELRFAEWREFDLAAGVWTIPASRTKMRKPHFAPLPRQAVAILEGLQPLTGRGALVLPGYGTTGRGAALAPRPLSENTMNAALRRMGFDGTEMTSHGFRSTASTLLNQCGLWQPAAVERALAHGSKDVAAIYNRSAYWQERAEMGQWWADQLDLLRAGQVPAALHGGQSPQAALAGAV